MSQPFVISTPESEDAYTQDWGNEAPLLAYANRVMLLQVVRDALKGLGVETLNSAAYGLGSCEVCLVPGENSHATVTIQIRTRGANE